MLILPQKKVNLSFQSIPLKKAFNFVRDEKPIGPSNGRREKMAKHDQPKYILMFLGEFLRCGNSDSHHKAKLGGRASERERERERERF